MTKPEAIEEQVIPVPIPEKKGSFLVDALTLTTGATLAQGFIVLISPVLSRLYLPHTFGTAAVFTSLLTIISLGSCLRYELAIMLPEKKEDAANLLVGSLIFVCVFTILTVLGVLFLGDIVCSLLKSPSLRGFLWMLPIAVFANGSCLALRYWNTRCKRYGYLSIMQVISSLSIGTSKLVLGVLKYASAGSLIGSNILGSIIWFAGLSWKSWRADLHTLLQTNRQQIVKLLKRYYKFPLVASWSSLLNVLSLHVPAILLSMFFSQTVVGYYSFGMRIVGLPMVLIGYAISQVFFQRASDALHQGNLGSVLRGTYKRLVSLGLFPLLLLGLLGPDIFSFVLGTQWAEAGVYAQIICLWQFLVFIGSPISALFFVLERQGAALLFNIVLFVSRIVSLAIGGWLGNARLALALYAGSGILVWLWLILWLFRSSNTSRLVIIADPLLCFLYAMPGFLLLAAAKWWWQWSPFNIMALAGLSTMVYYLVVIWRDRSLKEFVLSSYNRVRRKIN